jgi:nucleotide-binding universal stress UspA family protein
MPFKDMLVVVDDSRSCAERIDVAVRLAGAAGAHLAGLHVTIPFDVEPSVFSQLPLEVREMRDRFAREEAAKAKDLFEQRLRMTETEVESEWRAGRGDPAEVVSVHARYADLTVLGQTDPDAAGVPSNLPERVIMSSGRPALVVPYAGHFPAVGRRVMVAWNATREAARAVNDAMPILESASSVRVVSLNPHGTPVGHGPVPGADIGLHLARHGVSVEVSAVAADDVRVDDMLLSLAADMSADLIVMGGYGHSRLGELVLGGATRHILRQITIPVFMSH